MVSHKQIYQRSALGGVSNTTLCGRVNNWENEKNGGSNVEEKFTCKFCLKVAETVWGANKVQRSEELIKAGF